MQRRYITSIRSVVPILLIILSMCLWQMAGQNSVRMAVTSRAARQHIENFAY